MTVQVSQRRSPESEKSPPSPTSKEANIPTPIDCTSLAKVTYFFHSNVMMSSVSFSQSTLAARRVGSQSKLLPEKFDFQQPIEGRHNHSYGQPLTPPLTSVEIASPTFVAARDYYLNINHRGLETPPPSSPKTGMPQGRFPYAFRSVTQSSGTPRRHSVAVGPYLKSLEQMKDLKLRALEVSRRGSATSAPRNEDIGQDISTSRVTANRERWMQKVFRDENNTPIHSPSLSPRPMSTELPELPTEAGRQIHNPLDPRYLGNIPFSYTTNKLREWGDVYLFNSATADAFIRAIAIPAPIQSPSPSPDLGRSLSDFSLSEKNIKEEEVQALEPPTTAKQLIKVKVVPQCKTRKPFFMQKAFPIRKTSSHRVNKHPPTPRYHLRHHREGNQGAKVGILRDVATEAERRLAVPIR